MSPLLLQQNKAIETNVALPFITIALQIDSANASKASIENKIRISIDRVENDLKSIKGIPNYMVTPAVNRLKAIINSLDYNVNKKSVIIFLSPFIQKIYYVGFLIEEKVVVGEPLNIRGLVLSKREEMKYLVLSIHPERSFIYIGKGERLEVIVFNSSDHIKSHFYTGKEKFLTHVDKVLTHILKTYSVPLIAVGTETLLSRFKSISKNSKELVHTLYADIETENAVHIQQLIKPLLDDWETLKENYLLMKLNKAVSNKKAEIGIHKVSKAAKEQRGKLLIIEKGFSYPFQFTDRNEIIYTNTISSNGSLVISDAVEDTIEKVLSGGGNIEFVNNNVLKDYMHIALIV